MKDHAARIKEYLPNSQEWQLASEQFDDIANSIYWEFAEAFDNPITLPQIYQEKLVDCITAYNVLLYEELADRSLQHIADKLDDLLDREVMELHQWDTCTGESGFLDLWDCLGRGYDRDSEEYMQDDHSVLARASQKILEEIISQPQITNFESEWSEHFKNMIEAFRIDAYAGNPMGGIDYIDYFPLLTRLGDDFDLLREASDAADIKTDTIGYWRPVVDNVLEESLQKRHDEIVLAIQSLSVIVEQLPERV